jgi:hypothetical protein
LVAGLDRRKLNAGQERASDGKVIDVGVEKAF